MRVMKPTWCTIYFHFIFLSHYASTCSRFASSPSSGGSNGHMWQLVPVVHLSRLSADLACMVLVNLFHSIQAHQQSTNTYNTYQQSHIYIAASWWWATSKPKTCRGIVTQ
jgi:hypothetical protein